MASNMSADFEKMSALRRDPIARAAANRVRVPTVPPAAAPPPAAAAPAAAGAETAAATRTAGSLLRLGGAFVSGMTYSPDLGVNEDQARMDKGLPPLAKPLTRTQMESGKTPGADAPGLGLEQPPAAAPPPVAAVSPQTNAGAPTQLTAPGAKAIEILQGTGANGEKAFADSPEAFAKLQSPLRPTAQNQQALGRLVASSNDRVSAAAASLARPAAGAAEVAPTRSAQDDVIKQLDAKIQSQIAAGDSPRKYLAMKADLVAGTERNAVDRERNAILARDGDLDRANARLTADNTLGFQTAEAAAKLQLEASKNLAATKQVTLEQGRKDIAELTAGIQAAGAGMEPKELAKVLQFAYANYGKDSTGLTPQEYAAQVFDDYKASSQINPESVQNITSSGSPLRSNLLNNRAEGKAAGATFGQQLIGTLPFTDDTIVPVTDPLTGKKSAIRTDGENASGIDRARERYRQQEEQRKKLGLRGVN